MTDLDYYLDRVTNYYLSLVTDMALMTHIAIRPALGI